MPDGWRMSGSVSIVGADGGDLAPAFYFREQWQDANGESHVFSCKAWRHGPSVMWDVMKLMDSMGFSMKKGPYRIIDDESPLWFQLMDDLGFESQRMLFLSKKQCASRHMALTAFNHDEACVTSLGVLIILLRWSVERRRLAERSLAFGHLVSLLRCTLGPTMSGERVSFMVPQAVRDACRSGCCDEGDSHSLCRHLLDIAPKLAVLAGEASSEAQRSSHCMHSLLIAKGHCKSVASWLPAELARVAALLDEHVGKDGCSVDPLKCSHTYGKRKRIDEDFKRAVSVKVVQKGMAASGAQWARAQEDLHVDAARRFDNQSLREEQAAGMLNMANGRIFSLAMDGSRLGEPAKEHFVSLLWCHDTGKSVWLAPQALARRMGASSAMAHLLSKFRPCVEAFGAQAISARFGGRS